LNLSAADTVILYDSDLNQQMDQIAIERAYTAGQKNPVSVYRLVTKNTIEEKIVEFQTKKEEMTIDVLKKMMAFGSDVILDEGYNKKED
jgi:SNF2 family DNA or RNA helicase